MLNVSSYFLQANSRRTPPPPAFAFLILFATVYNNAHTVRICKNDE